MKYMGYRPTWAEVNLKNLLHNFNQIKNLVSPGVKVMVTVKADAYGHGLVPVAKKLQGYADFLGVASIEEGIILRKAGIKLPILILGIILKKQLDPIFRYRLTTTVCDEAFAAALNKEAKKKGRPADIHLKVDTGMGRIGVLHYEAKDLVKRIHKLEFINIEGIFTHFPFADTNEKFTQYQIDLFNSLLCGLAKEGINIALVHSANSIGTIEYKHSHFNMVRPGLVIYGLYPKEGIKVNLKAVLSLKTKVIFSKKVPAGFGISYGHAYVTKKETRIVTLPVGYGDGYPRNLSNKAPVLIAGRRFKISGKICMDQVMVDVGDANVRVGDEVVLIGSQGKNNITAEELASLSETIPYEIVCGLGSRIPRVYID